MLGGRDLIAVKHSMEPALEEAHCQVDGGPGHRSVSRSQVCYCGQDDSGDVQGALKVYHK